MPCVGFQLPCLLEYIIRRFLPSIAGFALPPTPCAPDLVKSPAASFCCALQEAIYQLLRLAGLLEALPLPAGSAQADLVAASISQKATLAEREVASHTQALAYSPSSHAACF